MMTAKTITTVSNSDNSSKNDADRSDNETIVPTDNFSGNATANDTPTVSQ